MIKQQVDREIAPVDNHAFLPRHKRQAFAQLQQKRFYLAEQRRFANSLRITSSVLRESAVRTNNAPAISLRRPRTLQRLAWHSVA
jgi:ribosomal protein L28